MPLLLAVTLAAAVQPVCSWDHPGHNPYTGGAAAAIDRYTDIPENVRRTLKRRLEEGQADDQVNITRDHITGKGQYDPAIRDMHFGKSSMCASVTRSKWAENRSEPGAVYCVEQHCILVPRICSNVSRINRSAVAATAAATAPVYASQELIDAVSPQEFAALSTPDMGLENAPPQLDESPDFMSPDGIEGALHRAALEDRLHAIASRMGQLAGEQMLYDLGLDPESLARRQAIGSGTNLTLPLADGQAAQPVPEADTWAMLAAGLGLVGWQARRRARKAAAQAAR